MSKLTIVVFSLLGLISACVGQGIEQNGQCDPNVPVITNFIASQYDGIWYDIESFPSEHQTGTCNTASYILNAGGLSITNSQVNTDGIRVTATGTATFLEPLNPGLAKFNVVIGSNPSVPYWVLATDYNDYALVYSCVNIDSNRRRVNSWKLARTQGPLSAEANIAINAKIAEVPALSAAANAYERRDHSAFGCSTFVNMAGTCPTALNGAADFNATTFQGTWYESYRFRQESQTGQCNRAEYGLGNNGVVSIRNTQVNDERLQTITGAAFALTGRPGVLQVNFDITGVIVLEYHEESRKTLLGNLWNCGQVPRLRSQNLVVLATDNINYALLYSCQNLEGNQRRVYSWQLRKSLEPLAQVHITAINVAIAANADLNSNQASYVATSQSDASCFYYPVFPPLQATIDLPGPCSLASVTGATAFNAETFVGTWYEIERYPTPTQTGQCNSAEYRAGTGGVITIQNRQVLNETLGEILGQATPVTGQPGVFDVTLETSNGSVLRRLFVLATNNINYALLYSCQDIEGNMRRVSSWKLSKQLGPLSAEANAAIDSVIAVTQGLDQTYYQPTSQTDASCFYYPEFPTLPVTIDLPGPCSSASLTGAAAFDAQAFVGTWYEVARYPTPTQTGQCNRATYGAGPGGVIAIENRQVVNENLRTIVGQATPVAGQNGVLEVTLETSSGPAPRLLYVLATDNNNYALLYSCQDIAGNQRRVGSWILSKQLGAVNAEANAVIDEVIANTQGLRTNYYQLTSQSNDACFHYPEWPTLPATIDLPGPCSTSITGATAFNAQTFVGTWYEVARYPTPTQTGQCNRAIYGAGTDGVITIQNRQVVDENLRTILGQATPVAGQPGVLQVTLNTSNGPVTRNLVVLATDNTNFALLYSCENIDGNQRRVGSWKLSKQLGPLSAAANATIDNVVGSTQGLIENYYQSTSQSDEACFYYPEWETLPANIDLPGPCSTSITGATAFNAQTFVGTWYEVARYPTPTQTGQCNRAIYGAGPDGVITIQNRQVVDENLRTILGQATPVAGQPGVLQVTLNTSNGPVTRSLVVLATDNTNFALLYSCENIDGNQRRVGSWKLSKQLGPLSAAANATIDNVVGSTQGLIENYYQSTSQSDEACFYYPEWETLPANIDLPGPCNTSINGASNFNAQTFLGTWYEVARYPQPTQAGQCNRAVYGAGTDGAITVQNSQVNNETLSTILGQATAVAGQTGVLEVILNTSSGPVSQTLVVLATDNNDYALLYSCRNIDGNQRRVGSWKLSKQLGPLSAAANATIDNVVGNTQGLLDNYYQSTSQADEACFHYPAQTGEKVIIPGQCATIPGHTDINMTRFATDIWYHIQRYDEVGNRSCISTRLSLAGEGNSVVVNSVELVGNVVNRTEGTAQLTAPGNSQFTLTWSGSEGNTTVNIVATNYDEYAIAYTCENSGNENRQVGVWLLSRQRTWPSSGAAVLTTLVNSRQEFTQRVGYFKQITHNDECPEPNSAFLFKSSIIVILVCTILQFVW